MKRGLTVIIPSRTESNLFQCVGTIRRRDPRCRIIVIDDGLPIEDYDVDEMISGVKPFCYARNVNIGIRAAGDDDVILLNDDALLGVGGGFLGLQFRYLECPIYGLLAAATNVCANSRQFRSRPGGWTSRVFEEPIAVNFVCVFIPRSTINRVGLLEERFSGEIEGERIYGGEDDDYCYRVRKAGLKIGIWPGCFVDHASLKSSFRGAPSNGLPIHAARRRFEEIHGFRMGTR